MEQRIMYDDRNLNVGKTFLFQERLLHLWRSCCRHYLMLPVGYEHILQRKFNCNYHVLEYCFLFFIFGEY